MSEKAKFIRIPPAPNGRPQTQPTEPDKRISNSEIKVSRAEEADAEKLAEGFYKCFPEDGWAILEPIDKRPDYATRIRRFASRIRPGLLEPKVHWLKATYVPTGEIVGAACWMAPGLPVHSMLRRDAYEFYGWREKFNMTQEDVDELWKSVDHVAWDNLANNDDKTREELLGDEPHWYLAPLFTWPEWQGRGVGKLLMQWAIEQADATDPVTPMYLESSAYARAVYMHTGFVPQGARNMVRRGPAVVKGLEAEDEK